MKRTTIALLMLLPVAGAATLAGCGKSGEDPVPAVPLTAITLDKTSATLAAGATLQLSAQSVVPADATDKTFTWGTLHPAVATVSASGLVTINATAVDGATASITATANDGSGVTGTCAISVEGVMINGVVWARTNVAAVGAFAAAPEAPGMFYQWNIKTAWAAAGEVQNWNTTDATGDEWLASNDPCPGGWRVPTPTELGKLADEDNVESAWVTSPANGRTFTAKPSGPSIFLPAAGWREHTTGTLVNVGRDGQYWSGSGRTNTDAHYFFLNKDGASMSYYYRTTGQSVRCVKHIE